MDPNTFTNLVITLIVIIAILSAIIDYGKELMKHENADDHYIGEVLWALGYKVLSEETEMARRKYESGQSNRA